MQIEFSKGIAAKGFNEVNKPWLGRCWGYWLPRLKLNGGLWQRGQCCDVFVYWLCFWIGVTVWKDEKPKCNKTCDSCLWFSCGIGPNSEGECMQSGASCKRGSDACDEWTNK